MDFNKKDRKIFSLQYGDLLVCEGGEIGRCAIWRNQLEECYFQKALHRVRVKDSLTPQFLQYVFWYYAHYGGFKNVSNRATVLHLTGEKLKETEIPVPPIALQNKFATIVEKVRTLKEKYKNSLKDLETLYGALSHKAFKGELDLSRIPITAELQPKDIITGVPQVGEPVLTLSE